MTRHPARGRGAAGRSRWRAARWCLVAGAALAVCQGSSPVAATGPGAADTAAPEDAPYALPVILPAEVSSPALAPEAPYTPTVVSLLDQLLPPGATAAQVDNAVSLLTGGPSATCHGPGTNGAPAGTSPVIMPLCWVDAQGVNSLLAPGETTAPMELVGLAASFDRRYANAWGQVEGREGRQLMMTGLLGPQADVSVVVNWRRGVNSSTGEDPFLGGELAAAQVNGMQGAGLMSQLKHFGPYNGTDELRNVRVQDQAMHEVLLAPFERAVKRGGVASLMASYQIFQVDSGSAGQPLRIPERAPSGAPGAEAGVGRWPLDERHFSSEHPWLLSYVLRELWGSPAFVGPDYGGQHSTSAILQGLDMEPGSDFLGVKTPQGADPTGSACADGSGTVVACAPGAAHPPGIPSAACGPSGCGLAEAVKRGVIPASVLRRSLARLLYQEERFGLLGCNDKNAACANPGGVGSDRTGRARLPTGPARGAPVLGTKNGDAAIVEAGAERGAVLLKNDGGTLPITAADLAGGVMVTGGTAEHLVAAPFDEAATGFTDRIAVGPLDRLKVLSGRPEAFTYSPANDATGRVVPSSALSTSRETVTGGLSRTRDGEAPTPDAVVDYTGASGRGQLAAGSTTWTGYLHVPVADVYTFRFQVGTAGQAALTFTLDGGPARTLQPATSVYHGHYYGARPVPVSPTVAGFVEAGLSNLECHAGAASGDAPADPGQGATAKRPPNPCPTVLAAGDHAISIRLETDRPASFRFACSRAQGDIADAAADARGKALAVVFASDDRVKVVTSQATPGPVSDPSVPVARLPAAQEALIEAVAAANPRTVVVLNTGTPVVVPWVGKVRSVLELWNAGQEGGTATARLLLGDADPSGHTPLTWPTEGSDTLYAYPEPAGGLYPGSVAGRHPERLNGLPDGSSWATQGTFVGYRYYDKLGLPVRFPFGHGLTYTTFRYGGLQLSAHDGGATVTFTVENTGKVAGTAVPQVYVGPGAKVPPGVQQAVRALRGFDRVELGAGEARRVSISLDERSFQYWDSPSQTWRTASGPRQVWVGEGLGDLRLSGSVRVEERGPGR
jgi:beta-glucosidase